jgi:sugar/nucleoside kinase (ribokinase family)
VTALTDLDVLGMACCCWDLMVTVEHYPALDEKTGMSQMVEQGGGQAATAMAAVAKLGGRAAVIGRVGDDLSGRNIISALQDVGVDTSALRTVPGATSQFAICVAHLPTGRRSIFWKNGSAGPPQPEEIDPELVRRAKAVLVDSNAIEAGIRAASLAREFGKPVVLDLEKPHPRSEELISLATHPIFPADYGSRLTGAPKPLEVCRAIQALGPENVIVTLGDRGCLALEGDRLHRVPAYRVPVIDTTGAGDVFHGVFAYGLALGKPFEDNLRFASAAAALCCRALGGRGGLGTRDEVEALIAAGDVLLTD